MMKQNKHQKISMKINYSFILATCLLMSKIEMVYTQTDDKCREFFESIFGGPPFPEYTTLTPEAISIFDNSGFLPDNQNHYQACTDEKHATKYIMSFLAPSSKIPQNPLQKIFKIAICLPDTCNKTSLIGYYNAIDKTKWLVTTKLFPELIWKETNITLDDAIVIQSEKSIPTSGYIWIFIMSVFLGLVIAGTLLNRYQIYKNNQKGTQPTRVNQVLQGFDLIKNTKSLVKDTKKDSKSKIFDLIRMIALLAIMYVSTVQTISGFDRNSEANNDPTLAINRENSWNVSWAFYCFYAVDLFFFMGGYVSIQSTKNFFIKIKHIKKWKYPFLYVFLIIKRYIRIMPC